MEALIFIFCVVVVFVVWYCNRSRASESELTELTAEINSAIDDFMVLNQNPVISENTSIMQIIPVDKSGIIYVNSDRISVFVLCLEDDEYYLSKYREISDKNNTKFNLVFDKALGSWNLKYTSLKRFNCNYKRAMPVIYKNLKDKYPNLNWFFDGSRIIWNK